MPGAMGSFEARKTQCLEASHRPRPFTQDAQLTLLQDEIRMAAPGALMRTRRP